MKNIAIISCSDRGSNLSKVLKSELPNADIYSTRGASADHSGVKGMIQLVEEKFNQYDGWIFIGALGITVRTIAPLLKDKKVDPAVISVDACANYAQAVISGHIGGANELTERVARILGAAAVISTQSDNSGLWALDTLGRKFNWEVEQDNLNSVIAQFVNESPTAVLLDVKDEGSSYLERTAPEFVDIYYKISDIDSSKYNLLIAVTPYIIESNIPTLVYRPKVLNLGVGCRKDASPSGVVDLIKDQLLEMKISWRSISTVSTIDIKRDEDLVNGLVKEFAGEKNIYSADQLSEIVVPNPSDKVFEVTGVYGVAESTALKSSNEGALLVEKQKCKLSEGNNFTFAVAIDKAAQRVGFIEIVGAGPGDPELVSVKGKRYLQQADLILYAGSLVPEELTHYAKPGAVVRSSASMDLEDQFAIMKEFYDKGLFVVRLHTGDPCIYGAIQEQMSYFDQYKMDYHITPGISSFLAAAAALRSQFTIPEKVQTIILTRGEGRTPMPDKEKLHMLARSQSTMCIFLSASIVEKVQRELLEHYPPETPVAACYKLTWKDEKIFRGQLKDLVSIIKGNNLTLTTMIVVGASIDNRQGLSKLYSHKFKHLFRDAK